MRQRAVPGEPGAGDRLAEVVRGELLDGGSERSTSSSGSVSRGSTRVTVGSPTVSVPVLSNTTARTRPASSMAAPRLMMMPRRAARPIPAITATGVARISGQGVATTSTDSTWFTSPVTAQAAAHITRVSGVNHTA